MNTERLDVHDVAARQLTVIGLRYTSNRRALIEALADATAPLSIPDLMRAMPTASQSSIYRNLTDLTNACVVARVQGTDEWARFELADAITGHHHHHIMCESCGEVLDIEIPEVLEHQLDTNLAELAEKSGYKITHHRLDLVGRCSNCQ